MNYYIDQFIVKENSDYFNNSYYFCVGNDCCFDYNYFDSFVDIEYDNLFYLNFDHFDNYCFVIDNYYY